MKLIQDIRVYKSDVENTDGNAYPREFAPKALHAVIHRIVMKLREANVTLGDFDHLYLNFTTCLPVGAIEQQKGHDQARKEQPCSGFEAHDL